MVKLFGSILLCSSYFSCWSQSEIYKDANTLEASATIAPSWMLNRDEANYYIMGYLEFHLSKNLSLRGDTYLFVDGESEFPFFSSASRTFFGVFAHTQKSNWDSYIGFQPGLSLLKPNPYYGGIQTFALLENRTAVVPSVAITVGTSYYVWKYYNFFANLSYIRSTISGVPGAPMPADELILSAGLGFQIDCSKK